MSDAFMTNILLSAKHDGKPALADAAAQFELLGQPIG
jgi:hypothetical protein